MVFFATYHSPLELIVIESDGEVLTGLRFADENVCSDRAERGETETGMMEWGKMSCGMMEHNDAGVGKNEHCKTASAILVIATTVRWLDDYFSGKQTENATMGKQTENAAMGKQPENVTMGKQTKNATMCAKADVRIVVQPGGTMFQQRVWQALLTIPYGETVSYGEIARMVGCKSAQAVGQAIGANPIALLIPCHRVIAANGKLGGYAYGEEIKKRLLACEQQSKSKTQ